jgi:RNA polymerase sigma-70 factor (ECF subfamily)
VIDWQAIVDEHGPVVWRTIYRLVSRHEDALDCYQETFLRAARYASEHAVSNWPALLKQMATTQALDCLRRRYRVERRSAELELASDTACRGQPPDTQAELSEVVDRLREALAELPPSQAEVFWLREIELMNTAEAATLLQITPDDVATRLHRAKVKLRRALSPDPGPNRVRPC